MVISSPSNPKIKYVKQLSAKKFRDREGKFVIEGFHLVEEALRVFKTQKQFNVELALFSEKAAGSAQGRQLVGEIVSSGAEHLIISDEIAAELSAVESPQGVFAVVKTQEFNLHELLYSEDPLVMACFEIQDPGNLGTMMRSAHAARSSGMLLSKGTVEPYNDKVVRSSMGSIFHVPFVRTEKFIDDLCKLKKAGIRTVAAYGGAKTPMWSADLTGPIALVFGGEGSGLSEEVERACDCSVSIPMPGGAESLNVAVSASILLYEVLRQRKINERKT